MRRTEKDPGRRLSALATGVGGGGADEDGGGGAAVGTGVTTSKIRWQKSLTPPMIGESSAPPRALRADQGKKRARLKKREQPS